MGATDVYVQKPISYDVVEGQAMVAAARKYKRTVQVGLERRSTPHILEARDRYIKSGQLGKIAYVDIHSYYGSGRSFDDSVCHMFPYGLRHRVFRLLSNQALCGASDLEGRTATLDRMMKNASTPETV